jgi:membrane protease YdiL (CAAX protease family)
MPAVVLPAPSVATRRPDRAPAATVTDPKMRRLYGWELLVVLAIFPLGSSIAALMYLLMRVTTGFEYSSSSYVIVGEPGLSLGLSIGIVISEFAAAALVIFLLVRNEEGIQSIGLGGHQFRRDLALVLPVYIVVQLIPQELGSALVTHFHLPGYSVSGPAVPAAFVVVSLLKSLQAAVVEEIVVLGYLVRRLEQRGWTAAAVVLVAVLVRVSYHVYYGAGVLPIVLWALASVLVYRRLRRLLPFIICHFVWDAHIAVNDFASRAAANTFITVFYVAALTCTLLWSRSPAPPATLLPRS